MLTITSPYVQIADLNGDPLDDGSVYIGTAGLNAETNPITVYWDAAGTQPAAQPIKTRSGVVARNGSPARIYTSATAYSITVRDKVGRLLASELSISSSVDASGITDGTIAEVKLDAALAAKINGALQKSGGTMTGAITLPGNATNALEAVPKQQAESIAASAASDRVRFANRVTLPTTSGVAVDLNSLPTWAQRITVILDKVGTSGTDQVCLQLGTAISFETTSYEGSSTTIGVSAVSTSTIGSGGFSLPLGNSASTRCGKFVVERVDGNVWQCSGDIGDSVTAAVVMVRGRKSLSGVLTRIRLTTIIGTDTFDGGQVSMIVEGW